MHITLEQLVSVHTTNNVALLCCEVIAYICYLTNVILTKNLIYVGLGLMKKLTGNSPEDETLSRVCLKMIEIIQKFKSLRLLDFEKLK
jgi:hypothetical protein